MPRALGGHAVPGTLPGAFPPPARDARPGSSPASADPLDEPLRAFEQLWEPFQQSGKSPEQFLVGLEAEKFGVYRDTGRPLVYEGSRGVTGIFGALVRDHGWRPVREREDGPIIALARGRASISLEPGAQLELSGSPEPTVHGIAQELQAHFEELRAVSAELGVRWLAAGFHPTAHERELPWVPKQRYGVMREYFPTRGARGLDMMRRTATVQVNLDYRDELDAMRKLRVALKLSPLATAIFANAPFREGRVADGHRSVRAAVWLDVDPQRTGLLPQVLEAGRGFDAYVDWALDVPMFLFKRDGRIIRNTGQTFRSFWEEGFGGYRATRRDWEVHLNTLFPEVRLKRLIEIRGADSLPRPLACAVPAFWTGLLYDAQSLDAAEAWVAPYGHDELVALRAEVARRGLGARLRGRPLAEPASEVIALALEGLARRARCDGQGRDERVHLEPVARLAARGWSPADVLLDGIQHARSDEALRQEILRRTKT